MKFDVAAFFDGVMELEEGREFREKLRVAGLEIGFIEELDGDGDNIEGLLAGFGLDFGEVGGDFRQVAGGGGDELFGLVEDFGFGGGGFGVDVRGGVERVF